MENTFMETKDIKKRIEDNFKPYWTRIFHVVDDLETGNGMKIKKDNKADIKKLQNVVKSWEAEIDNYHQLVEMDFDLELFDDANEDKYENQEFKDNIFAQTLWTVKSALKSATYDKEMKRYLDHFKATTASDIFVVIKNVLEASDEYIKKLAPNINYNKIREIEQLHLDYLDDESMYLTGVIGLGIRSELLHRLYPANFAIMTRRSLWGMFYLSNEADEFVVDEINNEGTQARTSHNWQYKYDRFVFYNNFLGNLLEIEFKKYKINFKANYRFGYVNMFLNEVHKLHKSTIDTLYSWK